MDVYGSVLGKDGPVSVQRSVQCTWLRTRGSSWKGQDETEVTLSLCLEFQAPGDRCRRR